MPLKSMQILKRIQNMHEIENLLISSLKIIYEILY